METEPNLTADLRLLAERSESIVSTMEWLAGIESGRLFREVVLAVSLRHRRMLRQITRCAAVGPRRVRVVALEDKYPQCHPALLCKVILGREPADDRDAMSAGALVLPLATVAALQEARDLGQPNVARVVTVSGDAVERPGNLVVPFGTPIARLIEHVGLRRRPMAALAGGPMTGIPLPDTRAVTSADVAGVTLLSRLPRGEPIACVRCGWCVEDCPAGIDPRALSQLELRPEFSKAERVALGACIECGVCSYVCPSQLPLAEALRQCRRRLDDGAAGSA
jgi:electron transport complex protein RnfC